MLDSSFNSDAVLLIFVSQIDPQMSSNIAENSDLGRPGGPREPCLTILGQCWSHVDTHFGGISGTFVTRLLSFWSLSLPACLPLLLPQGPGFSGSAGARVSAYTSIMGREIPGLQHTFVSLSAWGSPKGGKHPTLGG